MSMMMHAGKVCLLCRHEASWLTCKDTATHSRHVSFESSFKLQSAQQKEAVLDNGPMRSTQNIG